MKSKSLYISIFVIFKRHLSGGDGVRVFVGMVVSEGGQRATPPAQQRRFGNFDALKNTILPSLVRGHQPENRIWIHGDGKLEHMKNVLCQGSRPSK